MAGILKGIKAILGDVEMAPYTVIVDRGEYEERLYPARKWVCSSKASIDREACQSSLFRLLFNYISGKNKPNIRIDMTSPVTTLIAPGGSSGENKFTMAFLIPEEHQNNPPDSDDQAIFIEERPEIRVLTRRFGGYANEVVVTKEAQDLANILQKAGEDSVNYDHYYLAGYDPPFKPINRKNEIWYIKQIKQKQCDVKTEVKTNCEGNNDQQI